MIFWKYKLFTMIKLPHSKHTSVLLDICHHHIDSRLFSKAFSKLRMEWNGTFQIINHLTNSAIQLKITFLNIDKKKTITISSYSYFLFVHFFTFILNVQSNIQQYYPSFYTFYESHFFPGQTPVPPRSGTCILDLSHDPIWAIWLAEVTKFHQHHDRITHWYALTRSHGRLDQIWQFHCISWRTSTQYTHDFVCKQWHCF